ncbi:hypothetical protein DSO57_1004381 [Entomophthora muscae]|uniref:Uncharacterized protein n=1 Tax=Entomophthora muscae TaxID=34485 RepID=A0ACC2U6S8_9FUNG|nr:hypothetical protein DSO57_1004381 [Entomophthora muscae]
MHNCKTYFLLSSKAIPRKSCTKLSNKRSTMVQCNTPFLYCLLICDRTINFGIFLLALMRFLLVTLILFWCIQAFQILKKEQERLDIPNKISQSAQKVTELVENIAGNTPKNDTKPLDMPQSPTHKGSVSPDLPNSAPPKEEKSPGLLDFVGSSDFNPTSPKLQPTHEKKFSCIFCLKPLSPNVIRCPYCTSILNPCRYHCAQEDLKISK